MDDINYEKRIKEIIGVKAGLEPKEIKREMFLDADLNLGDLEIQEIVEEIEEELLLDLAELKDTAETVEDLILAAEEVID